MVSTKTAVGTLVGALVGSVVGAIVGPEVGTSVGTATRVGAAVSGATVGASVGASVGALVGAAVGATVTGGLVGAGAAAQVAGALGSTMTPEKSAGTPLPAETPATLTGRFVAKFCPHVMRMVPASGPAWMSSAWKVMEAMFGQRGTSMNVMMRRSAKGGASGEMVITPAAAELRSVA
mmetsp:Transcript_26847/g.58509  ORF Transcript_26847/g.58509 Transcript_26847/m.58509 type:complete len:178 (-) Transcript_26847:2087-2620(-)